MNPLSDRSLSHRLMGGLCRLAPARERDWLRGMHAELAQIDGEGRRLRWALGASVTVLLAWLHPRRSYGALVILGGLAVGLCEARTDEPTVVVTVLAVLGLVLGAARPSCMWLTAAILGSAVFWAELLFRLTDHWPAYHAVEQARGEAPAPLLSLLVLLAPALLSSAVGAAFTRIRHGAQNR